MMELTNAESIAAEIYAKIRTLALGPGDGISKD